MAITGNLNVTGVITASDIVGVSTLFTGAIGIQSAGTVIGAGITQLNFIGSGNTFAVSGSTVDISISGGSGGGLGVFVGDQNGVFSYIEQGEVDETITLDTSNSGVNTSIIVTVNPILAINDSNTVTVGAGKSLVVDILPNWRPIRAVKPMSIIISDTYSRSKDPTVNAGLVVVGVSKVQ